MTVPHVVIIGAGFAGLRAAQGLANAPVTVTVLDRSNHHLFQPLLYQVATAGLSPAEIATPIRNILRHQSNTEVHLCEVIGIDPLKKRVLLPDREMTYDILVIATGARHGYFGHDEWEAFAPGLKSIQDATRIRERILLSFEKAEMETDPEFRQRELTFILVGAGPTGVEMAGSIAELASTILSSDFRTIKKGSARILLIEAGPRILASFSERSSSRAIKDLTRLGVEVMVNSRVGEVDAEGVVLNGKRIYANTVIWAAGVVASPAGKWLGAETDRAGRVLVQPDLSVPGYPDIFVLGDTACFLEQGKPLPGVAPVAMQQGYYVADLIKDRLANRNATRPFHYRDKGNLATIGRSSAVAEIGRIRLAGGIAWLTWLFVHILYLIGFRNRVLVVIQWAWAYVTFQRGARIITTLATEKNPILKKINDSAY